MIVQPDAVHSFDCQGASAAMFFVDPESTEGAWLHSSLEADITVVPEAPLLAPASALRTFVERPLEGMELGALIRHCVQALSPGAPPARRMDSRVSKVLQQIHGADELRISLEDAADFADAAHLTRPFIRWSAWRRRH